MPAEDILVFGDVRKRGVLHEEMKSQPSVKWRRIDLKIGKRFCC